MKCAYCESRETKVMDKREPQDASVTRRRRECLRCKKRFTTYERVEEFELTIVKKNEAREQFNREKLKSGVVKACEKLPISVEEVDTVIDSIEAELRRLNEKEVSSKQIGSLVMKKLKKLNKIAYIRFAAVYHEFEDIESFEKEIKKLVKR
ncbi:transcriptional regulator NrdR [Candidatus Woesearchaeota archaeon]|nr:transcriptional regulator NrdR [Candidatus Woesearchaeota archaeon]|tara:strand:- start:39 stop:491 length:453 start_codon:yes stop_codon:yes gene_type:complete